jgi:tellurite resistance protein
MVRGEGPAGKIGLLNEEAPVAYTDSIDTPWGRLVVHLPTAERLDPLATLWPFGLGSATDPDDRDRARAEFQLPLHGARGALPGAFMAHLPGPQTDALARVAQTRRILARATGALAAGGREGVTLLCATLREEGDGVATSGVGVFVIPVGSDRQRAPRDELEEGFEVRLGPGGGAMVGDALRVLSRIESPPPEPVTGIKLAAAPYMGNRWLDFMVVGGQVVCLMDEVDPSEPVWSDLADGGVREVIHMPVGGATPSLGFPQAVPEGQGALSAGGARRVYRLLCHIAAVDGTIDPRERVVLDEYRGRLGIQRDDAGRLMQEGVTGRAIEVGPTRLERALLLEGLLDVAAADGVLAPEEEAMLAQFAEVVGLPLASLHHALRTRFADMGGLGEAPGASGGGSADEAPASQPAPTAEQVGAEGLRRIYRLLWNMAACDDDVDPLEETYLEAFRAKYEIGEEEASALAAQGERGEALRVGRGVEERLLLIESLIGLAAADGVLAPQEERKLSDLAATLGIPPRLVARALAERFPAEPAEELEQAEAVPAEQTARVVLLDLPHDVLSVDLHKVQVGDAFRGFRGVPAGVHRFAVPDARGDVAAWVQLEPGDVAVLAWDGRRLRPAKTSRTERYGRLAGGEGLGDAMARFPLHVPWQVLTAPLDAVAFPPPIHPVRADPAPDRLEQAWLHTHRGNSRALLAELSYAFLLGVLGDAEGAMRRWTHLVQGIYHAGQELPKRDPSFFVALVDLLIAQQQLLPRDMLGAESRIVAHARSFAQDLVLTDVPELVEAGKRWAVFCAANHRSAPARSADPAQARMEALTREIAGIEGEGDVDDARLLELLFELAGLQEQSGDLRAALGSQARLLRTAEASGASSLDLARGYQRLGRLAVALGDRESAEGAAIRVRDFLRQSFQARG